MSDITVEELIAERTEKAAESLMMAEAHDAAGHADVALGWRMSAEYADATADHLSRLRAKVASLNVHIDAQAATIKALVEALEMVTDKQWMSISTMEQCAFVDAALAAAKQTT